MRHVFIIGSRGLPAKYGGFETFVEELVTHQQSKNVTYHVACLSDSDHGTHFFYRGADCFTINPPQLGAARVMAYDLMAVRYALKLVKTKGWERPIFYLLGNTIGGIMPLFARQIWSVGGVFYINPDGLEWRRTKWPRPVRAYLKLAERFMCQTADLVIADNIGIEDYIKQAYPKAKTTCIAYGTTVEPTPLTPTDAQVRAYFDQHNLREKNYYLILGRFVPENNYETIIREFMESRTQRDLVIICNQEGSAYFERLKQATGFDRDSRIKFVGTVYDKPLVAYIRQQAFAYIHGHEVGGTNPSLLEALAQTDLNLVLDVSFNRTVAGQSSHYWTKQDGSLAGLIDDVDGQTDFTVLGQMAKGIIRDQYTWEKIVGEYEDLFLNEG
ncbi:beta 1-4 rhamnosyltransferase Cps2T [Streptococcus sp. E24BD]|uniref:beta 1-4 rhamnosyltransferase Cps2T n=1 Tax=Streptococcus sp. E24BD TaxID=3278715 RepID=UPI00359E0665